VHYLFFMALTKNASNTNRMFFGFIYNLSSLRQEDNFVGPNCSALLSSAQKTNDRRLARLLGHDALIFPRQNSGFTPPAEEAWAIWREEDEAHAADAEAEASTATAARKEQAL